MGMDLSGTGGYFRWTNRAWSELIDRAEAAGWEGIGTGPPRGVLKADWPGYYFGNQGQRVYARDAKRLATALESVLSTLSNEDVENHKEFIDFCRAGSFRIY